MKKILLVFAAFLLLLSGCTKKAEPLSFDGTVTAINISSLPEGINYSISDAESIDKLINYFTSLHLESKYSENPDTLGGMTWVIEISYADGRSETINHFGNMFLKKDAGPWYKMDVEEASQLAPLLEDLMK